jgi:hypothetical protein
MRLVVLSFIFCFSLSLSVPNLLSARPTSTETKEESALLALISKRKHVLKKKIHEKKTKTSLFLFFFFFFFFAGVGQREKEECGFLSLSLLLPPITLDVSHALIFARVSKKAGKEIVFGKQEQGGDSPYFFPSVSALLGKPG